ncbi:MAG: hypothetical protein RBU37_07660 [Myxococcota bacterium]|jgi:hypothetical protein|nr:hypothetical protein [Myxococcota bacterium]
MDARRRLSYEVSGFGFQVSGSERPIDKGMGFQRALPFGGVWGSAPRRSIDMKDINLSIFSSLLLGALLLPSGTLQGEVTPTRSWTTLVSSNGFGAVVVDLVPPEGKAQVHHFREHIYAAEEPLLDSGGNELWSNGAPLSVMSRDLLFDILVGVRADGGQNWLKSTPVDLDASGYEPYQDGAVGGTPIIRYVQRSRGLELSSFVWAPWSVEHATFVLLVRAKNTGSSAIDGVSLFTLHNFHLGYGRPGPTGEVQANGESLSWDSGTRTLTETGFAGALTAVAVSEPSFVGANHQSDSVSVWNTVDQGGSGNLSTSSALGQVRDDWVSGFQKDLAG